MFRGLLATLALAACGSSTSLPVEARCNPLGAGACLAPWPSSAFEIDDPTTVTGRRLAIPEDAIPRGASDEAIDPARWNALDGFVPTTPIIVELPGGVASADLPAADNMDLSLAADSPTVILDLTTGQRVAHHAEIDDDSQALILHPAARLAFGHRYAVALTSRLVAADGSELPLTPGFRALVNDRRTDHPLLEAMRSRIDEVLDALDEADVVDDLVLAWDFTVASESSLRSDVVAARDRARATLATYPSLHTITQDTTVRGTRKISGTLDGPLFLSNGGEPRANTRLVRDDAGLPAVQGLYRIPFAAVVPPCARPMPVAIWGHASWREASAALDEPAVALAKELCAVVIATDLRGRSEADVPAVKRAIADLASADELDAIVQGIVDHATLIVALDSIFGRTIDPARLFYVGDHLAIAALPELRRAGIIDGRSSRHAPFSADYLRYDAIDALLVRTLIEARWDRVLPARFGHPVLVQAGHDEPASWLARTFGLPIVDPPRTPWGVRTARGPLPGSGVVFDERPTLREFFTTGQIRPAPM